jgi:hypothetical protein
MQNYNGYYLHKRATGYYGLKPLYLGRASYVHVHYSGATGASLTEIDTGVSLASLVDDMSGSPFSARLAGEGDPVEDILIDKEQILRARVKHLADTLASRYELKDKAVSMMDYEQCKLQGEIWNLERWPLGIQPIEAKKAKLESDMLRLEKDKADEATTTWKDVFSVKGEFLDAIRDLRRLQSQRSLLGGPIMPLSINTGYGEGLMY